MAISAPRAMAVAALLVLAAACNDSGGAGDATNTDSPATTDDAAAEYCDLVRRIDATELTRLSPDSPPDDVKAAASTFLEDNAALLDEIQAAAPDEISDAYGITVETLEEIARTGDLSLIAEPDAAAADLAVQTYQRANC